MRTNYYENKWFVTAGKYNYFCGSYEECVEEAKNLQKHDIELKVFYIAKYGFVPESVDIHPEGYYVTSQRYN